MCSRALRGQHENQIPGNSHSDPAIVPGMAKVARTHRQPDLRLNAVTGEPVLDARPLTKTEQGYGTDWQRLRKAFAAEHPFCRPWLL
jgi:hypothetical protein